jgi:hypothetical protein
MFSLFSGLPLVSGLSVALKNFSCFLIENCTITGEKLFRKCKELRKKEKVNFTTCVQNLSQFVNIYLQAINFVTSPSLVRGGGGWLFFQKILKIFPSILVENNNRPLLLAGLERIYF